MYSVLDAQNASHSALSWCLRWSFRIGALVPDSLTKDTKMDTFIKYAVVIEAYLERIDDHPFC